VIASNARSATVRRQHSGLGLQKAPQRAVNPDKGLVMKPAESVPALPRGKARCRAATARYWKALHESGTWEHMDALGRVHAEQLLQLVERLHRSSDARERARLRKEIFLTERELLLSGPAPGRLPPNTRQPRP
jgi:hypothetical protein